MKIVVFSISGEEGVRDFLYKEEAKAITQMMMKNLGVKALIRCTTPEVDQKLASTLKNYLEMQEEGFTIENIFNSLIIGGGLSLKMIRPLARLYGIRVPNEKLKELEELYKSIPQEEKVFLLPFSLLPFYDKIMDSYEKNPPNLKVLSSIIDPKIYKEIVESNKNEIIEDLFCFPFSRAEAGPDYDYYVPKTPNYIERFHELKKSLYNKLDSIIRKETGISPFLRDGGIMLYKNLSANCNCRENLHIFYENKVGIVREVGKGIIYLPYERGPELLPTALYNLLGLGPRFHFYFEERCVMAPYSALKYDEIHDFLQNPLSFLCKNCREELKQNLEKGCVVYDLIKKDE